MNEERRDQFINWEVMGTNPGILQLVNATILDKTYPDYMRQSGKAVRIAAETGVKFQPLPKSSEYQTLESELQKCKSLEEIRQYCVEHNIAYLSDAELNEIAEANLNLELELRDNLKID